MVVAYKTSATTAIAARRLIRIPRISLVNILADAEVVPELLQGAATPGALADALRPLIAEDGAIARQREGLERAMARLSVDAPPSRRAAQAVLDVLMSMRPSVRTRGPDA
jgi:lipid-A-disaccharide synthase